MKIVAALFLTLFLVNYTVAIDCPAGYYDPSPVGTKCTQCDAEKETCSGATFTYKSVITGYSLVGSTPTNYCPINSYYNKDANQCEAACKMGCLSCLVDYDFCISCHSGFFLYQNACLPVVLGLEAATFVLLCVALLFTVISCCYVNKARK